MVLFEVGDIVIPTTNIVVSDLEYPILGVSGTVLARDPETEVANVDPANYNYLVQFSSTIVASGIVTSGTTSSVVTSAASVIWVTGLELGVSPSTTITEYVSISNAMSALATAQTTTANSKEVVSSLKDTVSPGSISQTSITNLSDLIEGINETVSNTTIDSGPGDFTQQEQAGQSNISCNYHANDAVLLQEAAENIAQIQAVIDEQTTTYTELEKQVMDHYYRGLEEDLVAQAGPTNNEVSQETLDLEQQIKNSLLGSPDPTIIPEIELEKIKL